jgi:hypothetical protein
MAIITDEQRADIETLRALIACSPIVVRCRKARQCLQGPSLPAGFDRVDAAILGWIAAEGRRVGRGLVRM